MRLEDRVAGITGAAQGTGRAIAIHLPSCAGKASVNHMTTVMGVALAGKGIRVSAITAQVLFPDGDRLPHMPAVPGLEDTR